MKRTPEIRVSPRDYLAIAAATRLTAGDVCRRGSPNALCCGVAFIPEPGLANRLPVSVHASDVQPEFFDEIVEARQAVRADEAEGPDSEDS